MGEEKLKERERQRDRSFEKAEPEKPVKKIDVDVRELESAAGAKPNAVSIMSAPAEKKKFPLLSVLVVVLFLSLVGNVVLAVALLSKSETISILRSEIEDYKSEIIDLKTQINNLSF